MITLARIGRIIWIIQIIKSAMNMTSDMAYTELFRLCGARVTPEQPLTTKQTAPLKASYFQRGRFSAFICQPTGEGRRAAYFSLLYSSSVTGSHHSLEHSVPGTSTARWENQLSGAAPCQCLTSAGMLMQSPGFSSTAGLPSSW